MLCASPDYLKRKGTPAIPAELANHDCLAMVRATERLTSWHFQTADSQQSVLIQPARATNDGAMIRRWAVEGACIALKSLWDVVQDIKAKRLVTVLDASINAWMAHAGLGPWLQIKNIPLTCVYKGEPSVPMIDIGLAYRGDVQIELIRQANDAPSPYRQYFIDGRMGLHHIAHLSDNVDADIKKAAAMGLDAVCDIKMPTGGRYAYLQNAVLGEGVFIELIDNNEMNQDMFKSGIEAAANWDGTRDITVIDFVDM